MKSKKKIVGVTGSLMLDPNGRFGRYWKSYVNDDYIQTVVDAGGIPYIIPVVDDESIIEEQVKNLDAVIFSGGTDISPFFYGEEVLPKCGAVDKRRDMFDIKLFNIVKKYKKPTLCICRGHQLSAVAHNGTLYQDLTYIENIPSHHDSNKLPCSPVHEINIDKNSLLYDILEKDMHIVNSFHHQAVKGVPKEFRVTAVSPDGIIEAMEYKDPDYFFISTQWHPEMLSACGNKDMLKLFKRLIS